MTTIKIIVALLIVLGFFRITKNTFLRKIGYLFLLIYGLVIFVKPIYNVIDVFLQSHKILKPIFDTYLLTVVLIYNTYGFFSKNDQTISSGVSVTDKNLNESHETELKSSEIDLNISQQASQECDKSKVSYTYCMDCLGAFSVRKDIFDSPMERKIYPILRSFFNEEYHIIPHIAFREVFLWEYESNWKLTDKVTKMHFDFGIYDSNYFPVLFIEVDGGNHNNDPEIIKRDKFKSEILKKNDLKLIVIDAFESIPDDEIASVVIQKIKEEVPSREDYKVYCPKCHSAMKIKYNRATNEAFYGCSQYRSDNAGCSGTKNITEVPELYRDMMISKKNNN